MKKSEATFLFAVTAFAVVFAAVSLSTAGNVIAGKLAAGRELEGIAGEARALDVEVVKRLIRQNYLSDREAEFYKSVSAIPEQPAPPAVASTLSDGTDKQ